MVKIGDKVIALPITNLTNKIGEVVFIEEGKIVWIYFGNHVSRYYDADMEGVYFRKIE
jgi:hypothetical protein